MAFTGPAPWSVWSAVTRSHATVEAMSSALYIAVLVVWLFTIGVGVAVLVMMFRSK